MLTAEPVEVDGVTKYSVWCKHCQVWHFHGPMEGHRIAHCTDRASPYWKTGYNLALAHVTLLDIESGQMATENPYRSSKAEQSKTTRPTRKIGLVLVVVFLFLFGLFLVGVLFGNTIRMAPAPVPAAPIPNQP